jgi:hypothetical protein
MKTFSRKEQEKAKPLIEDFIIKHLNGNLKQTVLSFVAYLRENNMTLKWVSMNGWDAVLKKEKVCHINVPLGTGTLDEHIWFVSPILDCIADYEKTIKSEGLQDFIWSNVFYCVHDPKSPYAGRNCNPKKGCAGGIDITTLGKEIRGKCGHRPHLHIFNPDDTALGKIKRLLELEIKTKENKNV